MAPDVVILGAGVMGASVAWHLAARGVRNIVVLDRGKAPGEGSTGRATGGFRAQYATDVNVRLSLLARDKLRAFQDDTGHDSGYHPCGYLWLASTPAAMDTLRAALAVQQAAGLAEAHLITPAEARTLNPAIDASDIVGGAFCATDGFIRPLSILEGYVDAAQRLGVRFHWGIDVLGVHRGPDDRVSMVRTSVGPVSAGAVVNALGPWAAPVMADTGFSLPVTPLCRQVVPTVSTRRLPADMPMTIFAADGFHLRVRDGRVLLLRPGIPPADAPRDPSVDQALVDEVIAIAHRRVPVLREVAVDRESCWAGFYEMSPDRHAILGATPGIPNLYLINGSSGHGVMHAPALGHLLAEMIVDGEAHTLDARALRPSRFVEGELNPISELL